MPKIFFDTNTGYTPEDELIELTNPSENLVADAVGTPTGFWCASALFSALSAAWGDGCPTTACTTAC